MRLHSVRIIPFAILLTALIPSPAFSQTSKAEEAAKTPGDPLAFISKPTKASWVESHHQITVDGKTLKYTATCGYMPIRNEAATEAMMFFISYTLDNPAGETRPLLFSFNGGPGSSSVWLHLGAIGPKRVKMLQDGKMPPPPYEMEDNPGTWLDKTDLCFIDPVGTGYSRPAKPELGQKYWNKEGDIGSIGEFIRMFLTLSGRLHSPLFVTGESYGTFRAAGLANNLLERGIALSGVILISTVLNFQALEMNPGNDLPYITYLPTYTATAFYHKKLAPDMMKNLDRTLAEAAQWAQTDYAVALMKGDDLTDTEREKVAVKLARYTGLTQQYVELSNLRINDERFRKELLRVEGWSVGRLDSRFKGIDRSGVTDSTDHDPSMSAIGPPYTSILTDYLRRDLKFESEITYHILGSGIGGWKFGEGGYPDTSEELRSAFARNPYLKVLVCAGYYDMATPWFGALYNVSHMGLDRRLKGNVKKAFYTAGHMMYIDIPSLLKLRKDVAGFIDEASRK